MTGTLVFLLDLSPLFCHCHLLSVTSYHRKVLLAILALHVAGESLDGSLAADDQCDNEGQGGTDAGSFSPV